MEEEQTDQWVTPKWKRPCECNVSCQKAHTGGSAICKTLIVRLLFFLQCFVSVWKVVDIKQKTVKNYNMYWLLLALTIGLVLDTIYTVGHRKGKEYKWASSSFFFFLVAAIPPIWLLEIDRRDRFMAFAASQNSTKGVVLTQETEQLSDFGGITIPLSLPANEWVQVLEQSLILLLVPTRWILPRGSVSRERLSQILLVYLALGADIIELFDLFDEEVVNRDYNIFIAILAVWSLSLCQFSLLLASSSRKARFGFLNPFSERKPHTTADEHTFDPMEVAALCMTMALQDIPFLCVRMYIMVQYKLVNSTLLFFACKNIYVILLQLYRISVITCLPPEDVDTKNRHKSHVAVSEAATSSIEFSKIDEGLELEQKPNQSVPTSNNNGTTIVPDKTPDERDDVVVNVPHQSREEQQHRTIVPGKTPNETDDVVVNVPRSQNEEQQQHRL